MNRTPFLAALLAAGMALILSSAPVRADKPEWAGKGHAQKESRDHEQGRERGERREMRFDDRGRIAVREYYGAQERSGRCPPGLAKKHNGCLPPGQAKKWQVGRPLPADVIIYDVPRELTVQIGVPPSGYKYVRAAGDILMVAVGTSMVVDAIEDLGRMQR